MEKTVIKIFLDERLPKQYTEPKSEIEEKPMTSIDELCSLYETKYGSFGEVEFHIYSDKSVTTIVEQLNALFESNDMAIQVDPALLEANREKLLPLIVVDNEIISRGVYPDLTQMRGGSNSVNRGGTGHLH